MDNAQCGRCTNHIQMPYPHGPGIEAVGDLSALEHWVEGQEADLIDVVPGVFVWVKLPNGQCSIWSDVPI